MELITANLGEYVVVLVVLTCMCVGYIIKHIVPGEKINKFIPLIMGVLGIGLNIWINLSVSPEIILGGLISGLASTGAHQALTQFLKGE